MPPETRDRATDLIGDLAAVARRLRMGEILRTIAVALPLAAALDVLLRTTGLSAAVAGAIAVAVLAGSVGLWLRSVRLRWIPAAAARAIEAAPPSSRNVVITGEELSEAP